MYALGYGEKGLWSPPSPPPPPTTLAGGFQKFKAVLATRQRAVMKRLENSTRYGTLSRLTVDWSNIMDPDVMPPAITPVDEARLQRLGISIHPLSCYDGTFDTGIPSKDQAETKLDSALGYVSSRVRWKRPIVGSPLAERLQKASAFVVEKQRAYH